MKLETILRKSQPELKCALASTLMGMGYKVHTSNGFLYAKGSVPVLLVAHLDTVHRSLVKTICYSADGQVLMSPEGIGGDDRAGVYMVLQVLKNCRCHVLFCEDEEAGGIGARSFTESGIRMDVNYIVEFDRRGEKDAVFYDCDNPDFTKFVCEFGFVEDMGSFSDISVLAPHIGVAAVNISAGYNNEHTLHEYINTRHVRRNIDIVRRMVHTATERFRYIECVFGDFTRYHGAREFMKPLSPAPALSYLLGKDGELSEATDSIWLDQQGTAYAYFEEVCVAVKLPGRTVWTVHGLPAKYDPKHSEFLEIVSEDELYEYMAELEDPGWMLEEEEIHGT